MINNVVFFSGVQQSDSVIHIPVSLLFKMLLPFMLLYNMEQSSLCNTGGPCWLFILYIVVCTCQSQTPQPSLTSTLPRIAVNSCAKSVSRFLKNLLV